MFTKHEWAHSSSTFMYNHLGGGAGLRWSQRVQNYRDPEDGDNSSNSYSSYGIYER